jgi:RimJ/RimL family protein N-acetyltransferase
VIKAGFEVYNFPRIIAMTRPENAASIRVMKKIGMTFEKRDLFPGMSAVVYSILKEDYQSR